MTGLGEAAGALAEDARALQRLTLGPDDQLAGPADVREVISGLSLAISRVAQILEQLAVFIEIEHVKGTLAGTRDAGAGPDVREVSDALHRAGLDAGAMAATLQTARAACDSIRPAVPAAKGRCAAAGKRPDGPPRRLDTGGCPR